MPRSLYEARRDSATPSRPLAKPARLRACLDDLLAERDDALLALDEARIEAELGLPCWTIGALHARASRCLHALAILLAELEAVSLKSE